MHKVWSPSDATLEFFVCKMERMIFNNEKYNVEHITTIDQVKEFTEYLVKDLKVNINPDNDFADYVKYETGEPTFNNTEVERGNQLMEECCNVCKAKGIDIYDLMSEYLFAN